MIDTPCLAVRNLDQAFNNSSDGIPPSQDPPGTDISLLDFKSSSPPPTPARTSISFQSNLRESTVTSEKNKQWHRYPSVPYNPHLPSWPLHPRTFPDILREQFPYRRRISRPLVRIGRRSHDCLLRRLLVCRNSGCGSQTRWSLQWWVLGFWRGGQQIHWGRLPEVNGEWFSGSKNKSHVK